MKTILIKAEIIFKIEVLENEDNKTILSKKYDGDCKWNDTADLICF